MLALFAWFAVLFSMASLSFSCSTSEVSSFSFVFDRARSLFFLVVVSSSLASRRDRSCDSERVRRRSFTRSKVAEFS